jgi:hypothetical protein
MSAVLKYLYFRFALKGQPSGLFLLYNGGKKEKNKDNEAGVDMAESP